jgi:hypothetical protein
MYASSKSSNAGYARLQAAGLCDSEQEHPVSVCPAAEHGEPLHLLWEAYMVDDPTPAIAAAPTYHSPPKFEGAGAN